MKIGKLDLSHLTPRERGFLIGGAITLCALLLYFWVWSPYLSTLDELRRTAESEQALYQWTKTTIFQIQQHRRQGVSVRELRKENLLPMIEDSLIQEKLNTYVNNIQQKDGKIAVNFMEVPFDRMFEWLEKIWKGYAVSVYEMNVKKGEVEGTVQSYIILQG